MNVYICDDCGLQFSTKIVSKKICPRCESAALISAKIPDDEWSFIDDAINDEWAKVAKEKGLVD